MFNLLKISIRDLLRNRRRTLFTMLAIVLGVALLIFISGFYAGTLEGSLEMSIQLQTSHLQLRAESFDEGKMSLEWKDLLSDPAALVAQIEAMDGVKSATPVLWSGGMLLSGDEAVGVTINGVEPLSAVIEPVRMAIVGGAIPATDDRSGVLIGSKLAKNLGLDVGQEITLVTNTSDGGTDQAAFTIRGLYDTGVPQFDDVTVFMPLSKLQAFAAAGERATAIRVMLDERGRADAFSAAFQQPGLRVLTWRDLNALIMTSIALSDAFLKALYLIVLGVVAVVIANTLLMSVFERTREIGILSALGMKRRQILAMFLTEAGILGMVGVLTGLGIGWLLVSYYGKVGIVIAPEIVQAKASNMITYGKILYTQFSSADALSLVIIALVVILLMALYPASFAARLQPVESLHGK